MDVIFSLITAKSGTSQRAGILVQLATLINQVKSEFIRLGHNNGAAKYKRATQKE